MSQTQILYPQIPVLLTAIVTSPGFKLSPFCTLSTVGAASLIQRSCLGLVKMPMFALVGFTIVAVPLIFRMEATISTGLQRRLRGRARSTTKREVS